MVSYPVFYFGGILKKQNSNAIRQFRKYLVASVGSSLAISIYSAVDTIAIGKSEGANGAAALAVILPIFGVAIFVGILFGVGGSVIMTNLKAQGKENEGNEYFTASLVNILIITIIIWIIFVIFQINILKFFGADESILNTTFKYTKWISLFLPAFIIPTFLSSFIRNDNAPNLALFAVLIGGAFNIFGDWFFVFPLGLKIEGAALATVLGTLIQFLIMLFHFFSKKNTLRIIKIKKFFKKTKKIILIGIGASVIDLGIVIISILMNNQILLYGSVSDLAVYGVIASVGSFFQAIFSGIGQAEQPLVSTSYGSGNLSKVNLFLTYSVITSIIFGLLFTLIGEILPIQLLSLFVTPNKELIEVAPDIIRIFYLVYLVLGINIVLIYFLQSILKDKYSILVTVLRLFVFNSVLILLLPTLFGIVGLWIAQPLAEFLTFICAGFLVMISLKNVKSMN